MDQNNSKRSGMDLGHTQYFKVQPDQESGVKKILSVVYEALSEKGYDPVIAGMCSDTEINSVEDFIIGVRNGSLKAFLIDENKKITIRG